MSGVEVTKSEDDGSQLGASAAAAAVPAAQNELEVIFHDSDIAVLNKPSGLRTVPGKAVGPEAETRAHVRQQDIVFFQTRTRVLRSTCFSYAIRNCSWNQMLSKE